MEGKKTSEDSKTKIEWFTCGLVTVTVVLTSCTLSLLKCTVPTICTTEPLGQFRVVTVSGRDILPSSQSRTPHSSLYDNARNTNTHTKHTVKVFTVGILSYVWAPMRSWMALIRNYRMFAESAKSTRRCCVNKRTAVTLYRCATVPSALPNKRSVAG